MTMMTAQAVRSENTPPAPEGDREDQMTISAGKLVTFEYTLKGDGGHVIDTSEGGQPFIYTHGRSEVVPGLESELEGMQVGDIKTVVVNPEQGYGPINEQAIVEVPIDRIPEDAREVGRQLQGSGPDGQAVYPVVKEVRADVVVLNFNHPLAGETLHFDVKIVSIQEQPEAAAEGEGASQDAAAPEHSPEE